MSNEKDQETKKNALYSATGFFQYQQTQTRDYPYMGQHTLHCLLFPICKLHGQ